MLKKILISFILIVILLFIGGYFYLQNTKPQYEGELQSQQLKDEVIVHHDTYGIPHIYAQNADDAYFALGYLHAQERLFQIEMIRRVASGRLAEVVGDKALKSDQFFRTIGIHEQAEKAANEFMSGQDKPYQKAAWAYLKGINEFVDNGTTPLEFQIMGIEKQHFTPVDIYHTIGFMAFGFADGLKEDLFFTQIKNQLGSKYLEDIFLASDPKGTFIPVEQPDSLLAITASNLTNEFIAIFDTMPTPLWIGSNGFAIAGSKTKSGFPILENDTHMGYAQPSVWFEAHIEYPGYRFYGQHLAGIPFGLLGHNADLGWGFTMFENDDVDFYQEELKGNEYKSKDGWHPLKERTETIKVKDADNVAFQVKTTHHGPIINGVYEELDSATHPISVWWAYTHFKSTVLQASYQLNHAKNIDDVKAAAKLIPAPGLNLMYADKEKNIGWWALAKLPIRRDSINTKLLLDGVSGNDDHLGYYPFENNPHNVNPESGYVYTTNNQPDTVDGILYPGYYRPNDRATRINYLLENTENATIELSKNIILDVTSPVDANLAKIMALLIKNHTNENKWIYDSLRLWNGKQHQQSVTTTVYYSLLSNILYEAMHDELSYADYKKMINSVPMQGSYTNLISNNQSVWWDDVNTDKKESRDDIVKNAFDRTITTLTSLYSDKFSSWTWGKVHTLTHPHPLAAVKPLDKIFNVGSFAMTGGNEVLNNQIFTLDTTTVYDVKAGPAVRWLLDFDNIENSIGILPTGQSGNLMSDHYNDQAQMFVDGKFRKQMMNKEEIEKSSDQILIMKPKSTD